ncbi:MAG: ExbD/TolR family protein [Bdellovibrionales bacterium]|nr:ExbD/TolR family protein [Bdellovibrionales bacterium]
MALISSGGRRSRVVLSEINVTPFVDVMMVLLVIFMVTAPMMQQGLEIDLPKTAHSGVKASEDPFVLVVRRDKEIMVGSTQLPLHGLQKKLKVIFSTRKNKQVYLKADKKVDYGFVAEVMGEIRAAGIYQIGLVTNPKSSL